MLKMMGFVYIQIVNLSKLKENRTSHRRALKNPFIEKKMFENEKDYIAEINVPRKKTDSVFDA